MVHTLSCQLRLYRIHVKWNLPTNPKQVPPTQLSPIATLHIRRVKIEQHFAPSRSANDAEGSVTGADSRNLFQTFLSHLELLPSAPESRHREPTYPTIMAVFSCVNNSNNISQQLQEPFSIISRWELRTENQTLHSSFDKLASKRNNASSMTESTVRPLTDSYTKYTDPATKQIPSLVRLGEVFVDMVVLSLNQMNLSTVLSFEYSNGAIEFRDRATLKLIEADDNFGRVSSLQQIGFGFPSDELCKSSTPSGATMDGVILSHGRLAYGDFPELLSCNRFVVRW